MRKLSRRYLAPYSQAASEWEEKALSRCKVFTRKKETPRRQVKKIRRDSPQKEKSKTSLGTTNTVYNLQDGFEKGEL